LVAAAKFLVAATKILFVVPNFVAVTKPFFSVWKIFPLNLQLIKTKNSSKRALLQVEHSSKRTLDHAWNIFLPVVFRRLSASGEKFFSLPL